MQAAVLNTARGRWFLAEHAKRHRAADTATLLEAIGKLERGIERQTRASIPAPVLSELDEVRKSLAFARLDITAVVPDINDGTASRKALEALASLDRAEARLEGLIGEHASRMRPDAEADLPKASEPASPMEPSKPAPARNRVLIVRSASEDAPARWREGSAPDSEPGPARGRIQVVRGMSPDETRIPLVEDNDAGHSHG